MFQSEGIFDLGVITTLLDPERFHGSENAFIFENEEDFLIWKSPPPPFESLTWSRELFRNEERNVFRNEGDFRTKTDPLL